MIVSNVLALLLTQKGERYYYPEYGCNLLKFVFNPNDSQTSSDIEQDIKTTVSLFIPSLTIKKVDFNWNYDDNGLPISDNQLNVNVLFTFQEGSFSETGTLDLNF